MMAAGFGGDNDNAAESSANQSKQLLCLTP